MPWTPWSEHGKYNEGLAWRHDNQSSKQRKSQFLSLHRHDVGIEYITQNYICTTFNMNLHEKTCGLMYSNTHTGWFDIQQNHLDIKLTSLLW
jgi:hypothetical protein